MRFQLVRTKDGKKYINSGNCPALFKEDLVFDPMLRSYLPRPWDEYEVVIAELTVIGEGEKN